MNIYSTIDMMKRQALKEIMNNVSLRSASLTTLIEYYIQNGASDVYALSSIVPSFKSIASCGDFNANIGLSYLDIYALYSLSYSSLLTLKAYTNIHNSRYTSVFETYKAIQKLMKEKTLSSQYKYVSYNDFTSNSSRDITDTDINITALVLNMLSIKDALSLPIVNRVEYNPDNITFTDLNGPSDNISYRKINDNSVDIDISVNHTNKYGHVHGDIKQTSTTPKVTATPPTIKQFAKCYIGDTLLIKITTVTTDTITGITTYSYQTSIDKGASWSQSYTGNAINTEVPLYLLNNIESGLLMTFTDDMIATKMSANDTWEVTLHYKTYSAPVLEAKLEFNNVTPVSYVRFSDMSDYPLIEDNIYNNKSVLITTLEGDNVTRSTNMQINKRLNNIAVANSSVSDMKIALSQKRYEVGLDTNIGSKINYNYRLMNIKAVTNTYASYGSIISSAIGVEKVTSITLDAEFYSGDSDNITFEAILEDEEGMVTVPLIHTFHLVDNALIQTVKEAIKIASVVNGSIIYDLNYKIDPTYHSVLSSNVIVKDLTYHSLKLSDASISLLYGNKDTVTFTPTVNRLYYVEYPILISSMEQFFIDYITYSNIDNKTLMQTPWIVVPNTKVAYLLYKDEDNKLHTSIRKIATTSTGIALTPFTGNIFLQIKMTSGSKSLYESPYVYNCTLGCI